MDTNLRSVTLGRFRSMAEYPLRDEVSSFIIMQGANDAAPFVLRQVSNFQDLIYLDSMDFCIDMDDAIEPSSILMWCEIIYKGKF